MANFYGSSGNDTITGTVDADMIYGYAGDDTLSGVGGNDSIFGDIGIDTIHGGSGSVYLTGDQTWYQNDDGADLIHGGTQGGTIYGGGGGDVVWGGDGAELIYGDFYYNDTASRPAGWFDDLQGSFEGQLTAIPRSPPAAIRAAPYRRDPRPGCPHPQAAFRS